MKNLLIILSFITIVSACKKEKMCNNIQGTYRITGVKTTKDGIVNPVPDTGVDRNLDDFAWLATVLIVDKNQNYTQYQGEKNSVIKSTGSIECKDLNIENNGSSFYTNGVPTYYYTKF